MPSFPTDGSTLADPCQNRCSRRRNLLGPELGACFSLITAKSKGVATPQDLERPRSKGGLPARRLRLIIEYADERVADPPPIDELAARARVSVHRLSTALEQSVGSAPHAYILHRRIAEAKMLPSASDEPLSQIAIACGRAARRA